MKTLALVWAALSRAPAGTLLTVVAATAAFTLFGLMIGLFETRARLVKQARADQLYVETRDAGLPNVPYRGLPIAVGRQIERMDGVASVGGFKWFGGDRRGPDDRLGIFLVDQGMRGARPEEPIAPAQWDRLFAVPDGVLVTRALAKKLGLAAGDRFPITSAPGLRADGSRTWTFQVLAIIAEDPTWEDGVIVGNASYIENAAPPGTGGWGYSFMVRTMDPTRAEAAGRAIDQHFANSATPTYSITAQADRASLVKLNVNKTGMMLGTAGAGLFMILFLVANAVARSVQERMPEFAILHTLGFRRARLSSLVFLEALFPYLIGAILGTGLAAAITQLPSRFVPAGLSVIVENMADPGLPIAVLIWAGLSAAALALASSLLPWLKLGRANVADVLAGN